MDAQMDEVGVGHWGRVADVARVRRASSPGGSVRMPPSDPYRFFGDFDTPSAYGTLHDRDLAASPSL